MDTLDINDAHYDRKILDLQRRYDEQYDTIEEIEVQIGELQSQIRSIQQEKISGDNIYRLLLAFDEVYHSATEAEQKEFMKAFIERIEMFPEKRKDGSWIKKIVFNFPVPVDGEEVKELPLETETTVEALYQGGNGDIDNPSSGGSSDVVAGIAAVALTGAAVWGIYETGTGIYRVLNMPGVPMPSNRAGLATLIWEKAGCPEPQTVKSFSDIDDADLHLRQAASWMEEQGLMDDVKENEFRPYRYVTKLQTCLVWDKAKEKSLIS